MREAGAWERGTGEEWLDLLVDERNGRVLRFAIDEERIASAYAYDPRSLPRTSLRVWERRESLLELLLRTKLTPSLARSLWFGRPLAGDPLPIGFAIGVVAPCVLGLTFATPRLGDARRCAELIQEAIGPRAIVVLARCVDHEDCAEHPRLGVACAAPRVEEIARRATVAWRGRW